MNKQKWIAIVLAGGKGTRLNLLTHTMVKPAMPFGGKYRIIDFALSNCKNSGIETVGILTQYMPLALHSHLGSYNQFDQKGGLAILPPYQRNDDGVEWYEGTSHAVYQNIEFIEHYNPEHVLILSGDQVYKMDYSLMLEQHIETNADCTIAAVEVPWADAKRFGLLKMNHATKRILDFEEKPDYPSSNLASMGIYLFKWSVLKEYLILAEQKEHRDFGKDLIPAMLEDRQKLYAYLFKDYWKDVGTVHSYWRANLDLLDREKNIFLQNTDWPIQTVASHYPPLFLDEGAKVQKSLISEGCEIFGTVENSVLFNGVIIGKGAHIKNAVILPQTIVEENVWIENAVVGGQSLIKKGVIIFSKNAVRHLMVVGNHVTIDLAIEQSKLQSRVKMVMT
ncbi:glucose-1-phosphate adenylyltransferase [Neobacillus sp. M.A.Huq-85]|nr:glucose-1-phosphate adenylyltransferase [Neobacillus cucumis]